MPAAQWRRNPRASCAPMCLMSGVRYALPESIKQNVPEDNSVRTVDITKKLVALTFDDYPNRKYTNEILDTLEAYDSVATFFEVGNVIPNAPEAMKRAAELGCEIGSHSYTHKKSSDSVCGEN